MKTLNSWRWRQHVSAKRLELLTKRPNAKSQKTGIMYKQNPIKKNAMHMRGQIQIHKASVIWPYDRQLERTWKNLILWMLETRLAKLTSLYQSRGLICDLKGDRTNSFEAKRNRPTKPKPLKLMVMTLIIRIFHFAKNAPKTSADVILLFIAVNIRIRILTFLEVGDHDAVTHNPFAYSPTQWTVYYPLSYSSN